MAVEIHGADQFAQLAKALKEAGDKDLQKELGKGINRAVKPVKKEIKDSALATLPARGGLAARASKSKLVTRRRSSGRGIGVRVVAADKTLSMYHLNKGIIRHRMKGKKPREWTIQHTTEGFWDKAAEATGPDARRELEQAISDVAAKIDRAV